MSARKYLKAVFVISLFFSPLANADCFTKVGDRFHISPTLIRAIANKESRLYNGAVNDKNRNRTEDVCMMGINSSHYKELRRFGITRNLLLTDECTCIAAGTWILNGFFKHYGRSWDTVGMYNAGPRPAVWRIRQDYAADVRRIYYRMARQENVSTDPFAD